MTSKELQRWILKNDEEDLWWVALDGEVQDNVMSLPDVNRVKEANPDEQITVLHVSRAEDEDAEWIIFERVGGREMRAVSSGETTAPMPVDAAPVVDSSEVEALRADLASLRTEFAEFRSMVDELKQPIEEARKVLDERENFLEIGETALFDKAQKQEVLQTELEQLRDELNRREHFLEQREQGLERGQAAG